MSPPAIRPLTVMEWLLLILLSVLWGGSFIFANVALTGFAPLTLTFARVGIAALALLLYAALTAQNLPRDWSIWGAFAVLGLVNNILPFSLIFWGQLSITAGLAAILNATTPFFTVVLAQFTTRDEKLTGPKAAGLFLGFIGVTLIIGPDALAGITSGIPGSFAVLLAALCYAVGGLFARRFRNLPPTVTAAGQLTMSALFMVPVAVLFGARGPAELGAGAALAAVFALSLLSTAIAYVIYFRVLRTAGATNVLLVTFLIPVSAVVLGYFMLGERLAVEHFVGMSVIGLGLAAIDGRPIERLRAIAQSRGKTL